MNKIYLTLIKNIGIVKKQMQKGNKMNLVKNYDVQYDMMLECKMKEIALLKYRSILENGELVI